MRRRPRCPLTARPLGLSASSIACTISHGSGESWRVRPGHGRIRGSRWRVRSRLFQVGEGVTEGLDVACVEPRDRAGDPHAVGLCSPAACCSSAWYTRRAWPPVTWFSAEKHPWPTSGLFWPASSEWPPPVPPGVRGGWRADRGCAFLLPHAAVARAHPASIAASRDDARWFRLSCLCVLPG